MDFEATLTESAFHDDIKQMPSLYIPHGGGPCFFMEWTMGPPDTWHAMGSWLRSLSASLPAKPTAIVVISAHWEEAQVTINNGLNPALLYDYYGFPEATYQIKYDAPGSPELAQRVHSLLNNGGIQSGFEPQRGFDHGVFVPLKLAFPEADVPIVQVSLVRGLEPSRHLEIGRLLSPLRQEGVLIVGSGMSYHNLSRFGNAGAKDAAAFDQWLNQTLAEKNTEKRDELLIDWQKAPSAREAHPREEHLIPLMVAAGAGGTDSARRVYNENVMGMAISGFQFG